MKLGITITGPKVHDVGYRVLLGKLAMSLGLPGFMAYNWDEEGQQQVIALAEGDEARIAILKKRIEERKPNLAVVSAINFDDGYDGEVGRASEYAMLLSFEQFDKAIPILQAIKDNTDIIPQMAKTTERAANTTDKILEEARGIRDEVQPGLGMQLRQMQADIRALKERMGMP